jgi:hypothetical protein
MVSRSLRFSAKGRFVDSLRLLFTFRLAVTYHRLHIAFTAEVQHAQQHIQIVLTESLNLRNCDDSVDSEVVNINAELVNSEVHCSDGAKVLKIHVEALAAFDVDIIDRQRLGVFLGQTLKLGAGGREKCKHSDWRNLNSKLTQNNWL